MILFDGKPTSLHGILNILYQFHSLSGLGINRAKSAIFIAGLSPSESHLLPGFGFQSSSFPMRYLGLPLVQRKLQKKDYSPLLDSLAKRFTSWENTTLSYPGRLQLVISVINSTLNYWMQAFILPKSCLKRIEQMCSRFIWNGNIHKTSGIKVAWREICLPKEEGGLGLRDLHTWNKVLCLKLIWNLFASSGSLWVAWEKDFYCATQSFWAVEEKPYDSWLWKQLLRLRPVARPFIDVVLGNGLNTSFWFDTWCQLGPLFDRFGGTGPRQLGVPLTAMVAHACSHQGWILRPARSSQAQNLHIILTQIAPPSMSTDSDHFRWRIPGDDSASSGTWHFLRHRAPSQSWYPDIWYKSHIPKHAFIFWLAHLNRLPVKSRLLSWGLLISPLCVLCVLCAISNEDKEHLLFHCPYSLQVWRMGLDRLGFSSHFFANWSSLINWLLLPSPNVSLLLKRLVAQCTVYYLWRERNVRIHQGSSQTPLCLFRVIDRCVKDRILSQRDKKAYKHLLAAWFRYH